jgi:hypothetical protein
VAITIRRHKVDVEELRIALKDYEAVYGVASIDRHSAFVHDGTFIETPDFHRWSALWAAWCACRPGVAIS